MKRDSTQSPVQYAPAHILDDPTLTKLPPAPPFPQLCKHLMDALFLNQKNKSEHCNNVFTEI